ncbi:MAG: FliM/FliN family flagellar motor switch protein [Bdellovibrionales bacterium]|nr:FliM/FliN family flagellar motor switch protein [Bdellovibrionales bacterium]
MNEMSCVGSEAKALLHAVLQLQSERADAADIQRALPGSKICMEILVVARLRGCSLGTAAFIRPGALVSLSDTRLSCWSIIGRLGARSPAYRWDGAIAPEEARRVCFQVAAKQEFLKEAMEPLELAVELGRCRVELEALTRLTPGSICRLVLPENGAVQLTLDGEVLAHATIVDWEGKPALQIAAIGELFAEKLSSAIFDNVAAAGEDGQR